MKKEILIIELAKNKVDELKIWKKVRYQGGRLYYETTRISDEIKDYATDLQIVYLEYIVNASFTIQDNLPSEAPDITKELKNWIKKKIIDLQLMQNSRNSTNLLVEDKNETSNKIFISHSSNDIDIVKKFVEQVLQLGLDIPSGRIFCSSMEGYGIKSGQYMPDRLKEEIKKSCLAILFISPNYKASEICLNEVGAAWATLDKECVIPILLPEISFDRLGFLDLNRVGLKIWERSEILKLVQDCRDQLNPTFDLQKLHIKTEEFLKVFENMPNQVTTDKSNENPSSSEEDYDDWHACFSKNLYPFNEIIRKAIPALNDGIHKINSLKVQNQILTDLSEAKFLKNFWYKQAEGDYYVEKMRTLPSGNWLISSFNWEVKISEMWVCMDISLQHEFILIKSEKQEPYKIDSDVGGLSYNVGVLNDGTIVSENERLNGYAIINDEPINLAEKDVEPRVRDRDTHWVFLVSDYHKAGYNADETIAFCKKLDSGEIEVSEKAIMKFLRPLHNHPTVVKYN